MKKLLILLALVSFSIYLSGQEIYLAGKITAFDVFISHFDRPFDFLKIKGTLIFEKETLVIHTRRKGKDWVLEYEVLSVKELDRQEDHTKIDFTFKDPLSQIREASLIIYNDETWILEFPSEKSTTYYTGITLKQELFNKRMQRRY